VDTLRRVPLLLLLIGIALAAAGGGSGAAPKTVWLCLPGQNLDPCSMNLTTTLVSPNGTRRVEHTRAAANPPIDCFYVYPTVSNENRGNADLSIGPEQLLVAQFQAAPFSQVCRVYAPVYRQITNRGLTTPSLHANVALAYNDVLRAWRDYLAQYNHGRGVVLIGHSQGSYVLKHLVGTVIARSPAERRLLVSAILLGGQVHAPDAAGAPSDTGSIEPCTSPSATGCVIAYSSFSTVPPKSAMFGRSRIAGTHIVCVNPTRPGTAAATAVTPLFPSAVLAAAGGGVPSVSTPWVGFPGRYTSQCRSSGNASWLQISPRSPKDALASIRPLAGPGWGLHVTDVNIALPELVAVVRAESRGYR
jgi:hypothetical protein